MLMTDPRLRNERKALAACELAFRKLADDGTLRARALELVARWSADGTCAPRYANRWRELLTMPIERAREIVLAPTDEGQALRANSPFAAFFTKPERQALRVKASECPEP